MIRRSQRGRLRFWRAQRGQMTIELVAVLPAVIIVAVVIVNALTFFSECASFDRSSRNAVRVCAASPAYGQTVADSAGMVQAMLDEGLQADNLSTEVSVEQDALGHVRFTMKLVFRPTLFGLGLRDSILGVALPALEHTEMIVVDSYKPGMLF